MKQRKAGNIESGSMIIRVRYCECDPMGVAHHTIYPVWFEMGRTELLRDKGRSYRDLEAQGVFLAVVKLEVKYKKPARYDDELTLVTRLSEVGHVKLCHEYELRRNSDLLATAITTLACLDDQGRPREIPSDLFGSGNNSEV